MMGKNQRGKPIFFLRPIALIVSNLEGNMENVTAVQLPATPASAEFQRTVTKEKPGTESSDEMLVARTASGDKEGLALLFHRYARLVRSIGHRILRGTSETEDLVQDIFLFIQRKAGIFDSSQSSARSWIVQMAYQRAIERRRYLAARHFYARSESQECVERMVGKLTIEDDYSPEAVFGRNGLQKVFAALSDDQRETLRLYFFDGYTLAEISAKLGQPLGNVRNHYYRGLEKLRDQMFAKNHQRSG